MHGCTVYCLPLITILSSLFIKTLRIRVMQKVRSAYRHSVYRAILFQCITDDNILR